LGQWGKDFFILIKGRNGHNNNRRATWEGSNEIHPNEKIVQCMGSGKSTTEVDWREKNPSEATEKTSGGGGRREKVNLLDREDREKRGSKVKLLGVPLSLNMYCINRQTRATFVGGKGMKTVREIDTLGKWPGG